MPTNYFDEFEEKVLAKANATKEVSLPSYKKPAFKLAVAASITIAILVSVFQHKVATKSVSLPQQEIMVDLLWIEDETYLEFDDFEAFTLAQDTNDISQEMEYFIEDDSIDWQDISLLI